MDADQDIGQVLELGAGRRVGGKPGRIVIGEGFLQPVLTIRGRAWPEPGGELRQARSVVADVIAAHGEEARELEADFLEDPLVAQRYLPAGCLEPVERSVDRVGQPPETLVGVEQSAAHEPTGDLFGHGEKWRGEEGAALEAVNEILAAHGAAGLLRRPGGEGAPVGIGGHRPVAGGGEVEVRLRDPQVADHRVREHGYLLHAFGGESLRPHGRVCHGLLMSLDG